MGLFDYLKCEYPPPSPHGRRDEWLGRDWCEGDFRTRDFDCRLACELSLRLQREKRERFPATWFGRRVYPAYAWIVHTFGLPIRQLCHAIGSLSEQASRSLDRLVFRLAPYGDPIRAKQHQRRIGAPEARAEMHTSTLHD